MTGARYEFKICTACKEIRTPRADGSRCSSVSFMKQKHTMTHKVSARTSTVKCIAHHECKIKIPCYHFSAQLSSPFLIIKEQFTKHSADMVKQSQGSSRSSQLSLISVTVSLLMAGQNKVGLWSGLCALCNTLSVFKERLSVL